MKAARNLFPRAFLKKKKKNPGEGTGPLAVNALNFESESPGSCFAVVLFP